MVHAYNSIKIVNRIENQKLSFFDVICRHEYYAFWAGNGKKNVLTLQASRFVIAHHIGLGFVLCKKSTLWFSLF